MPTWLYGVIWLMAFGGSIGCLVVIGPAGIPAWITLTASVAGLGELVHEHRNARER